MPSASYFRVTSGLAFETCSQFMAKRRAALDKVAALAAKYGAKPDRHLSCGPWVEGFAFECRPPKHWKPAKDVQGYWVPDKKLKEGKAVVKELKEIEIPGGEDLAKMFGCEPFFRDPDGMYCTAIGCTMRGGVFYLEVPTYGQPKWEKYGAGVEKIDRGPYFTAVDAKE